MKSCEDFINTSQQYGRSPVCTPLCTFRLYVLLCSLSNSINLLKPNDFQRHGAVSPLNCQTTYKNVTNIVEVWRNFVHSYLVNCCHLLCCRMLEGQAFIQVPECTPPSTIPLHKHQYICRHIVTAHFSQLTNKVLTEHAVIIACNGVHCGLKYQHLPMKQTLALDQKVQWRRAPI